MEDRYSHGNGSEAAQARKEEVRWGLNHGWLEVSTQSPSVTPLTLCKRGQLGKGKRKILWVVQAME